MKVAYVQALGGASGDMLIASLIDAGLKMQFLEEVVDILHVKGITFKESKAQRNGVSGTHVDVILESEAERSRRWQDFVSIVEESTLSSNVKEMSRKVFSLIGEAESKVHGSDIEHVHLHELGTLDTLVDVVGVMVGLEMLGIEKLFCSTLPTGSGTVNTAHGRLMVPAPATEKILAMTSAPFHAPPTHMPSTGEMLTPTGAAILGSVAEFQAPVMTIETVGHGLGTRDPDSYPNALSLTVGKLDEEKVFADLKLLETNLDDSTGEIIGYVQQTLIAKAGVRDVWTTPISMKKNRPAYKISVLSDPLQLASLTEILMSETSTFGIRVSEVKRYKSKREIIKLKTIFGIIQVKVRFNTKGKDYFPEYEECRKVALQKNVPLMKVYQEVQNKIKLYLEK